jgi:hypothetical protein
MENSSQIHDSLPEEYILQFSGFARNLLLRISKLSYRLAVVGIVIAVLFLIFLLGSYFAEMAAPYRKFSYLTVLWNLGTPTFLMIFSLYYLFWFAKKTQKAIHTQSEELFNEGIKILRYFIRLVVLTLFAFLITALINVWYFQRIFEIWVE